MKTQQISGMIISAGDIRKYQQAADSVGCTLIVTEAGGEYEHTSLNRVTGKENVHNGIVPEGKAYLQIGGNIDRLLEEVKK